MHGKKAQGKRKERETKVCLRTFTRKHFIRTNKTIIKIGMII
jgi:hypothetical protein